MVNVSVIIPAYNSEKYIGKAIESVIKQTYQDFIILIGNDGSIDNTVDIIKNYKELYPNKIRYFSQENKGQASITNMLLREVDSTYVAYLDSDDEWPPEKLEKSIKVLDENKSIGVVYSGYYSINAENKILGKYLPPKFNKNTLLLIDYVNRSTLVHRSESIENVGFFDESITGNDDHDMEIRLSEVYEFYEIEPLAIYRIHGNNIHLKRPNQKVWVLETYHQILSQAYKRRGSPLAIKLILFRVRLTIIKISLFGFSKNKWISERLKNIIFRIEFFLLNLKNTT